jgi:hypothetical protein
LGKASPPRASSVWLVAVIAIVCSVVALDCTNSFHGRFSGNSDAPEPGPPFGPTATSAAVTAFWKVNFKSVRTAGVPAGTGIRQLAGAGYADLSVDDPISFKIHGVTPEYLQSLKRWDSPASLRIKRCPGGFWVNLELVRGLEVAGFESTFDQVISARVHGVNTNAVRELREPVRRSDLTT